MSQKEKLIKRIQSKPKDFKWSELETLLSNLGFEMQRSGKTGGSRRKFFHKAKGFIISLHTPHPQPILKAYAIEQIVKKLKEEGLI